MPEGGGQTGVTLAESFASIQTAEDADPFLTLLCSVDGQAYVVQESNVQPLTQHYDREGSLIAQDGLFSGQYAAGDRTYSITSVVENGVNYLDIAYTQGQELTDSAAIAMAEHIYQYFYHGTFDKSASLASPMQAKHATLTKNGNGYTLRLG